MTLDPRHATLDLQPSTLDLRPSTSNPRPLTLDKFSTRHMSKNGWHFVVKGKLMTIAQR